MHALQPYVSPYRQALNLKVTLKFAVTKSMLMYNP